MFHNAAFLAAGAPVWDIRKDFGETDMVVRNAIIGKSLALMLADKSVVLMRGHGDVTVGPSVKMAVFRAYYTDVDARLQSQALALGGEPKYPDARRRRQSRCDQHGRDRPDLEPVEAARRALAREIASPKPLPRRPGASAERHQLGLGISRCIGAMPQLVGGYDVLFRHDCAASSITRATSSGVSMVSLTRRSPGLDHLAVEQRQQFNGTFELRHSIATCWIGLAAIAGKCPHTGAIRRRGLPVGVGLDAVAVADMHRSGAAEAFGGPLQRMMPHSWTSSYRR